MDLPTIDLGPFRPAAAGDPARSAVVEQLARACREQGVFQLVGHGLDPALADSLQGAATEFFDLPEAEKAEIAMAQGGRAWRGWFPLGGELTSGVPDDKEGLYFGTHLPPADPAVARGLPLHGPNLYPRRPVRLAELVDMWMREVTAVGQWVLRALALGLGLPEHWFDRWCAEPTVLFRIFHYPPPPPDLPADWGVAEHTDYGLLTLLAQDATGGLEVRTGGRWVEVPPLQGSLVCNLGDMIERVTGGHYRSTPHRVRLPAEHRISMPLFLDPGWDSIVAPLPGFEPPVAERRAGGRSIHGEPRWDDASVFDGAARYGDYLLAKVARVFPDLFDRVVVPSIDERSAAAGSSVVDEVDDEPGG